MKYIFKTIITSYLLLTTSYLINAQTHLIINGGHWVNTDDYIILNNTKLKNNSSVHSSSETVIVTGTAATAQSEIGGTSSTTFHNFILNKGANDALLANNVVIENVFKFSSGKLVIGNNDLTLLSGAFFSGQNKDKYIVTDGIGTVQRTVGNTWTVFPVGRSTFNPARLKNSGTLDQFSVRVIDHFLQNGNSGSAITTNVIPRTWMIDEAITGGSDVSMQLVWRPLHHNGNGFNTNSAHISHFTGGSWQDQSSGASTADNSYSSDHRYREATNITSFSPFGVKSGASLPVELLYFYGEQVGNNVRLDWQTATEINNSHFDVEWSRDGISFEKIGEAAGAGTTNEVQFYEFIDDLNRVDFENRHGLHYYRLKQVDFDGTFEYTNTIQITIQQSNNSTIKIFPNPASHYLKIESQDLLGEMVQIFSVNGQLVKEFQHQSLITNLPITNLPSGTYFIKMGQQVKKLIIEK